MKTQKNTPRPFTLRLSAILLTAALALCASAVPALAAEGVVNVNEADAATLQLLPRVGPAVSQRIIDHRDENGDFSEASELMQVRGIGEKTFELLEPYVTTSGESTLTEKVRTSRSSSEESDDEDGGDDGR